MLGVVLAVISWKIMLCVVLGSMLLSACLRLLSYRARSIGTDVKRIHRDLWARMMVTLQGMKIVRAYAHEYVQHQHFVACSAEARNVILRELQLLLLLDPLTEVGYLIILGSIILGAQSLGVNFGTTLTCVALLYRLQPHVRELEGHRLTLLQLEPQLASVRAVLEAEQHEHDPSGTVEISTIQREIRFEDVSFRYQPDTAPALRHVSFTIPAGKITAVFGASGSGKTTIVNLLLRLYSPDGGRIWIDGIHLEALSRTQWLALVGAAGQDVDLISASVADNIRLGHSQASEANVAGVAEAMGVSEFLSLRADGEDEWTGQQGNRFSGGQRQRIGLARAVLHRPKLLILDEAMSAMDIAQEQQIWHNIRTIFTDCTILLITHRVETVLGVDSVICIENGVITGEGCPRELLRDPESALSLAWRARESG
jgi:ABC-type multidrug transport system fused ATPase/permease subunit